MSAFKFGTVSAKPGRSGPWEISEFEIKDGLDLFMSNFRAARDGNGYAVVRPGKFKRLTHDKRGVIMSNTCMEVLTAYEAYKKATGDVLVTGLGLGMVVEGMLSKPDVRSVLVIEKEPDVIKLVAPTFSKDPRITIVCDDAFEFLPERGRKFDYIWHDIWDDISENNLESMKKLTKRFAGRSANGQGVWSREELYAQRRRESNNRFW